MAKGKVWKPVYERYVVQFYDEHWEEDIHLREGPVSACGVCRIIMDYMRERDHFNIETDVVLSRYRDRPFITVEVQRGEEKAK